MCKEVIAIIVALSSKVGIWKVCAQQDERSDREERIPVRVLNSQPGVSKPNCDHQSSR